HHHDVGVLEDTVKRGDELLLSRSIHCKLFPVGGPRPSAGSAGCDLSSEPGTAEDPGQDDAPQVLPPDARQGPRRVPRSEPVAGLIAPKTAFPICAGLSIKPVTRRLQSRTGSTSGNRRKPFTPNENGNWLWPPSETVQKEISPNHHRFHKARTGAPTHWAG